MVSAMLERKSPREFAALSQVIECQGKIEDFGRLVELIESELKRFGAEEIPQKWRQAPVNISIRFGWARGLPDVASLTGRVAASVTLVCQRCLEPFDLSLTTDLNLLLSAAGDDAIESNEFEVWEFDDDVVSPEDIVEEALIMALPLSPRHTSRDQCTGLSDSRWSDSGWSDSVRPGKGLPDDEVLRPFADLKSLLADTEDKD